ncbi:MAG: GDP-mannose 4,6-dehydratase [Pirellulales bacterium]
MELSGKQVLVTGGAGFIGSHLVDALDDCRVRVLDDLSTGKEENLAQHRGSSRVELIRGDVRDPAAVASAIRDCQVVFHLACRGVRHSIGHPRESHEVNATGTLVVLAAAKQAGVARFVHVSSSEVYGTARYVPMDENHPCFPETVYGAAKLAGECYARAYHQTYGLPSVVVRSFNNFGPRSHHEGDSGEVIPRFVVWALNGRPPVIFGDGEQTRDFIYVEDTACWLRRVAECDELIGQTVNLGSGQETSVVRLAQAVALAVGQPSLTPIHKPPRPGDVRRHLSNVERARQLLGFRLNTSLDEGVGKLVEYFRSHPSGVAALAAQMQESNWTSENASSAAENAPSTIVR